MVGEELNEFAVVLLDPIQFRGGGASPREEERTGGGFQQHHPVPGVAAAQHVTGTGDMVGMQTVILPPRRHLRKALRMVALSGALHGYEREVLVDQIDTVHQDPVAHPLVLLKGAVPTGHPVRLAKQAAPKLMRNARRLLDREQVMRVRAAVSKCGSGPGQHVDSRHVLVRVK